MPKSWTKHAASSLGKIRIISGKLRGSRLEVPDVVSLRPTPDRVRETLFNWLMPFIEGSNVLDLFAGTGALGIEALSRGAAHGNFVERNPALVASLTANIARLKINNASVYSQDSAYFLEKNTELHDIVFLDPPFAENLWDSSANLLESQSWLKATAWIYVESPTTVIPNLPANWNLHREGRAGKVRFALYRRNAMLL